MQHDKARCSCRQLKTLHIDLIFSKGSGRSSTLWTGAGDFDLRHRGEALRSWHGSP